MDLDLWVGEANEVQAQLPTIPESLDQFMAYAIGAILLGLLVTGLVALARPGRARRAFRCPLAQREVEVEFGTRGVLWLASVRRCSAFEDPEAVACSRRCLDSRFRRQWEFAVPVRMWPGGRAAA